MGHSRYSSSWCYYSKWPQGGSPRSCRVLFFFFFPVNSLLFSIGVEWISAVFVLGVQELDSVIHRCLLPLGLSYTQMFAPFRA